MLHRTPTSASSASLAAGAAVAVPRAASAQEVEPLGDGAGVSVADTEARIPSVTNAQRTAAGLPPPTLDPCLPEAARAWSVNLAGRGAFEHSPDTRGEAGGRPHTRENIAMGYSSADEVMDGWMNSPGRSNLLNARCAEIGIGVARRPDGTPDDTQIFAVTDRDRVATDGEGQ